MSDFDPFAELQLSPDAEPELIKAAFKALAKKYHPDKYSDPAEKAQAEKKMARINQAQKMIQEGYRPPPPSHPPGPEPVSREVQARPKPKASPPKEKEKPQTPVRPAPFVVVALLFLALFAGVKFFTQDNLKTALKLEEQGRYQESLEALNRAVKASPHERELYLHRARLWDKLGFPDRAELDRKNGKPMDTLTLPNEIETSATPNQVPEDPPQKSGANVP